MARRPSATSAIGYLICLGGVLAFVVGCFLPYYGDVALIAPGQTSTSLYQLTMSSAGTAIEHLAVALYLFAGAATVGLVALAGIRRERSWTRSSLAAGIAAWALTWIGVLIYQGRFGSVEVGHWVMLGGTCVAVAGAVAVWVSSRGRDLERTAGAAEAEPP
jgi:hypothetical protein